MATTLPEQLARFRGYWISDGWNGVQPHALAVPEAGAEGRPVVTYAFGNAPDWNVPVGGITTFAARIEQGDLHLDTPAGGPPVRYALQPDGSLAGRFGLYGYWGAVAETRLTRTDEPGWQAAVAAFPLCRELEVETILLPSGRHYAASGRPIRLTASLYRPEQGAGPYPLILFSHGSTDSFGYLTHLVFREAAMARFFTSRGYAFCALMRRGRGASEGSYAEAGVTTQDHEAALQNGIADIQAALAHFAAHPAVDSAAIVLAGQSRGGFLSLAAAGAPGQVRGAINFGGGWLAGEGRDAFHVAMFPRIAATARHLPTLWLYAENDSVTPLASLRRWHDLYRDAGGQAEMVVFPAGPGDGHYIHINPRLWGAAVDDFLRRLMPSPS